MSNLLCVDTFFLYSHQISNEAGRFSPVYIIIDYKFYLMFCISTFCVHMLGFCGRECLSSLLGTLISQSLRYLLGSFVRFQLLGTASNAEFIRRLTFLCIHIHP